MTFDHIGYSVYVLWFSCSKTQLH